VRIELVGDLLERIDVNKGGVEKKSGGGGKGNSVLILKAMTLRTRRSHI